jgi:hypothetical protein
MPRSYQPRHAASPPRHLWPGRSLRPGAAAVCIALLAILAYLAGEQRAEQPWPASPAQAAPSPSASGVPVGSGSVDGGAEPPVSGRDGSAAVSTLAPGPATTTGRTILAGNMATRTTQQAQERRSGSLASATTPETSEGPSVAPESTRGPSSTVGAPRPPTDSPSDDDGGPPPSAQPPATVPPTTRPVDPPGQDEEPEPGPGHQPGCDPQPEHGQDSEHGHAQCEAPAG